MLRERPCDILVMDLIMPALDGFAVLSMMDTLPVRPRTLVLSALGRGDFITRAMQLGADYYMMKPFGCEELYNRIQDMSRSAAPKSSDRRARAGHAAFARRGNILSFSRGGYSGAHKGIPVPARGGAHGGKRPGCD